MKRRILVFFVLLSCGVLKVNAAEVALLSLFDEPQLESIVNLVAQSNLDTPLSPGQTQESSQQELLALEPDFKGILIYTLLFSITILGFLTIALTKSRRKTRIANQQLAAKNEEIRLKNVDLLQRNEETRLQHEAISAQRKTLEEMNQVKDKMFSIIAHDFRSPLNTIQGVLNLLHMDVLSPEELKNMLPHLTRKVDYSINLLDNLLNWARTQMNGLKVNSITFTLNPEIEETVAVMAQLARQKNIRVEKNIHKDCMVQADPDMIQLVVRNLLSNAIKFTNPGGLIQIDTEPKDGKIIISISDTGIGMDEESLQKLFKQSGYSTKGTAEEKGTGLGLKLCSEFVRRNNGEIWMESKVDEGTTFYFTVPLAEVLEESSYS
ncbi:MAG: HAMP domain-containing sensor histidine kinase [Cyclobacteriaceae bacterium]